MLAFLASLLFVGYFVVRNWNQLQSLGKPDFGLLVASAIAYAASFFTSTLAWLAALRAISVCVAAREALRVNSIAQIGKYLPGNVAHLFARGALLKQHGVRLKDYGISTVIEVSAIVVAACIVAASGLALERDALAPVSQVGTYLDFGSIAVALAVVTVLAGVLISKRASTARFGLAVLAFCASFLLAGISFKLVASAFDFHSINASVSIGFFAIAFLVGYLVPGAPAGLGVREAVLLICLAPLIGGAAALALSLTHRILSAATDCAIALAAFAYTAWRKAA